MADPDQRRYQISEVSEMLELPPHVLRQWEGKIPQLNPKRNRSGRRYYTRADIDIARRIKYLLRQEKMTLDGARIRLAQELHGTGRPQTRQDAVELLDKIEEEVRAMLDILDSVS